MARHAVDLPGDVPQGQVDAGDDRRADDPVAVPEVLAEHHLPEVLDPPGVLADDQLGQVGDRPDDGPGVPLQGRFPPAVQPRLIGGTYEVLPSETSVPTGSTAFNTETNRCYQQLGCSPGAPAPARRSMAASAGQFTGTKGYYDVLGRSFFFGFKASF